MIHPNNRHWDISSRAGEARLVPPPPPPVSPSAEFDSSHAPGAGFRLMNDGTNESGELGVLARRKIEAAIVAPYYDEMRKAIGEGKARENSAPRRSPRGD